MAEEELWNYIVRLRGLPWTVTVEEIVKFLDESNIKGGTAGVHLTMSREGRPSGEAFVELETEEDMDNALKKDKEHIGHRYIEVFRATRSDMERVVDRSGMDMQDIMNECCVRLRGLPFGCTKEDISNFFSGLSIVSNGITFVTDHTGRQTGEAYVEFASKEMVDAALNKHLEKIGHRYIEIFRSSLAEVKALTGPKIRPLMAEMVSRPMPYDRGNRLGGMNRYAGRMPPLRGRGGYEDEWDAPPYRGRGLSPPPAARMRSALYEENGSGAVWKRDGFLVHMRGLPYRSTEQDIVNFFKPLVPVDIKFLYERGGLPSGEADVEFATYEEAQEAMSKDKANIKNRYIELFLTTPPPSAGGRKPIKSEPDTDALFSRRGGPAPSAYGSGYDAYYDPASPTPSAYKGINAAPIGPPGATGAGFMR